ncbi:MAG: acyl transferase [Bacteroidetes bacterium]|nr:acyl transferase [Bacteroidota bacterium]
MNPVRVSENTKLSEIEISLNSFKLKLVTNSNQSFDELALEIFHLQSRYNKVYREYLSLMNIEPDNISELNEIPYLPIQLFKSHAVQTSKRDIEKIFISSGTSGSEKSKHYICDLDLYETNLIRCFRQFYNDPGEYIFIAYLPGYQENRQSSLIYMVNCLMNHGKNKELYSNFNLNNFYAENENAFASKIDELKSTGNKLFIVGVSFALKSFAENNVCPLKDSIIMETGGMKGTQAEITRIGLHDILKTCFKVNAIHSEYGMTELLSQMYSTSNGRFYCPDTLRVRLRDINDPLQVYSDDELKGKTGPLNIIDLANMYSCSFIATDDLGKINDDNSFEVLGRVDHSDIRGCNLMYVE